MNVKKGAVMQPYFLPYIGYWQLISFSDVFVLYDNIQFTKKGWINRNRLLVNGRDHLFSVPIKKDSDYLNINERYLSNSSVEQNLKTLRLIESSYKKAPFFYEVYPLIEKCFKSEERNLFDFILYSVITIKNALGIDTPIVRSSETGVSEKLKGQERVIATCKNLGITNYVNPIGGIHLYNRDEFASEGIELLFQKVDNIIYDQFKNQFEPNLSIIDVLMFNGIKGTKSILTRMSLV